MKRWRVGDRVMAAGGGAFAEYAIGHARRIYPLPEAAGLGVTARRFQFEVEILVRARWAGIPVVEAPVGVVWKLLTNISGWGSIYNVRVISVEPPGPAAKGQRMLAEPGLRWLHLGMSFEYTLIDETHYQLELDARFPLGMTVHEALDCVPLEDGPL